ncbi:acyl-CoA dehydrogenase family protein [Aeromicrobium wangtongii]|uniref:Acyl-CoA dehydrogenase family protein n=1 Tax=Aeromicrobium wangtongii TaxID=2969247 RepID=A0ABY5M8T4_9ACTN|nr:acyl-CoA dehydrogenase family protein [Aeromicrobium wangtongii]MCD9199807.1 hydroxylase [Aeromicrobium wangtongii]UUP13428.1 acyl-CoA dehydrogenase family protein [Aeromicrobium wangtongii]
MHEVTDNVSKVADVLRGEARPSDELGRLTDRTVDAIRGTGLVRLLQPKEYSGYEAHPNDFLEAVMAVGIASPSAGWVSGVVGVHPWEIAMMDPRLQEEIWGEDPDTWTASPYAPFGRATPVDGGFLFTGQWPYSTGTDHAEWVILGGIVVDAAGQVGTPPDIRHFVIPRKDYEIVEDSWNVMGLEGTGSKDVRMTDVFIPDYRVVEAGTMIAGGYEHRQEGNPLYRMKFPLIFSAAIAAGTQGIAQGAIAVYRDYMAQRVSADGITARTDVNQLIVFGEASADVAASRSHLLTSVAEVFDHVSAGGELSRSQRLTFRRDQVRASRRCADAVDRLYKISGASGIRKDFPNERYWRDLQVALSHICNVAENIYAGWSTDDLGGEASPALYV